MELTSSESFYVPAMYVTLPVVLPVLALVTRVSCSSTRTI